MKFQLLRKFAYLILVLFGIAALFLPIVLKFRHSDSEFTLDGISKFIASLDYGLDMATTLGFVGALTVFWINKQQEFRQEEEAVKKNRELRLQDNSRASTITFLQQTNDEISESLVQFDKKFFYKFRSLRDGLKAEMGLLDQENEAAFLDHEAQVASDDERYALDYKKMAPKFMESMNLMQKEFSEWSSETEKTVRGRFFNLLPILRTQSMIDSEAKNEEESSTTEEIDFKEFNNLLNRVHTARKNIVSLLGIFEQINFYPSDKLENKVSLSDDDGSRQYFENLLRDVTEFGEEFGTSKFFSDENMEKFAHTMKTGSFDKIVAVRQTTEEIVCSIVKPDFKGRDATFKVIDLCVDTYVDCLEDVAIYCAALQEAILTGDPKQFAEAKMEYRKIMEQSSGNAQSKFQAVMQNEPEKKRNYNRR